MKAINRLFEYFDYKSIKPTRFEKEYSISNGYFGIQLKRNADIGSGILEIIVNNCRDLNVVWLLTGEGDMLKKETQAQVLPVPGINSNELALLKSKDNLIEEKDKIIKMLEKEVTRLEAENEFLKQSDQDSKYSTKALFTKLNK